MATADKPQLVIGHPDTQHVVVRPQRYRNPSASDYWGGNWLAAIIEVQAGAFGGRVAATLRTEEFRAFHTELRELYDTLTGQAVFSTLEGWLEVILTAGSTGQVEVTGWVEDQPSIGNRLEFTLALDQSFLPPMLRQLEAILARFPVVGETAE